VFMGRKAFHRCPLGTREQEESGRKDRSQEVGKRCVLSPLFPMQLSPLTTLTAYHAVRRASMDRKE
jgi:hypothetical protein